MLVTEGPVEVSVIVCTHNRPDLLEEHLPTAIASAAASEYRVEVVVVDNAAPDDRTLVVARRIGDCTIVSEPVKGLSNARNAGIANSTGEAILFTDDDVAVPLHWVDHMAKLLLDRKCEIVAGLVLPGPGREPEWMGPGVRSSFLNIFDTEGDHHPIGSSYGLHRSILETLRFDPLLGPGTYNGTGDDVFFYEQAKRAGFTARGCLSAPVIHDYDLERLRYKDLIKQAGVTGRSRAYVAYHWLHTDLSALDLRIAVEWLQLQLVRRRRGTDQDGMSDSEYRRWVSLFMKQELKRLRGARRRYEPMGLTLLEG